MSDRVCLRVIVYVDDENIAGKYLSVCLRNPDHQLLRINKLILYYLLTDALTEHCILEFHFDPQNVKKYLIVV